MHTTISETAVTLSPKDNEQQLNVESLFPEFSIPFQEAEKLLEAEQTLIEYLHKNSLYDLIFAEFEKVEEAHLRREKYLALLCIIAFAQKRHNNKVSANKPNLELNEIDTKKIEQIVLFACADILETELPTLEENQTPEIIEQNEQLNYASRTSWLGMYWSYLDIDPSLEFLLPAQAKLMRAQGKHFDEIYKVLNKEQRKKLTRDFINYLGERFESSDVLFPFTYAVYAEKLSLLYNLTDTIPTKYWIYSEGSYSYYLKKTILFSDSSYTTAAHERHHKLFPGFRLGNGHIGAGFDEAMTEYLARRNIESLRILYNLWYIYKEETLRRVRWGNSLEKLLLSLPPFSWLIAGSMLLELTIQIAKTRDFQDSWRNRISAHDDLIAVLTPIFRKKKGIKTAITQRYQKNDKESVTNFWKILIENLGVEKVGALFSWQYSSKESALSISDHQMIEAIKDEP